MAAIRALRESPDAPFVWSATSVSIRTRRRKARCPRSQSRKRNRSSFVKQFDVAALGNAIVDVIALIDEFRAQTLYEALPETREIAGGSAANTMAGVASFGGNGLFVGRVKDDRLGESFAASMAKTGIDYS